MSKTHAENPPDGLECLVTMEDITAEDGNYGKHSLLRNRLDFYILSH